MAAAQFSPSCGNDGPQVLLVGKPITSAVPYQMLAGIVSCDQ